MWFQSSAMTLPSTVSRRSGSACFGLSGQTTSKRGSLMMVLPGESPEMIPTW